MPICFLAMLNMRLGMGQCSSARPTEALMASDSLLRNSNLVSAAYKAIVTHQKIFTKIQAFCKNYPHDVSTLTRTHTKTQVRTHTHIHIHTHIRAGTTVRFWVLLGGSFGWVYGVPRRQLLGQRVGRHPGAVV